MSLQEVKEKHTYREALGWLEWMKRQWNNPNRSDHYLMLIASEVDQVLSKRKSFDSKKWKIPFGKDTTGPKPRDIEEATAWAQARWFARVGVPEGWKDNGN